MKFVSMIGMLGVLAVLAGLALQNSGCSNNPAAPAPVTVTQPVTIFSGSTITPTGSATPTLTSTLTPVTILSTATFTPTGSVTPTFSVTNTLTSTWTPVTILTTATFTPTGSATPTLTPTNTPVTVVIVPTTCAGVFGNGTVNSGATFSSSGVMFLNRFLCSSNAYLINLSLNLVSGGTTFQLGIYSDNGAGTLPVSLLGDTGAHPVTGTGWNTATLPSTVPLVSGNYYWLAFHTDASFVQTTGAYPDQGDWTIGASYAAFPALYAGFIDGTGPILYALYGNTCH